MSRSLFNYSEPELVDVLPHYLGAKLRITWEDGDVSEMINENIFSSNFIMGEDLLSKADNKDIEIYLDEFKGKIQLVLHDPCEMSKDQKHQYNSLLHINEFKDQNLVWKSDTPASILFLLKNHIDAFDLIERGMAIKIEKKHKKGYLLKKLIPRTFKDNSIAEAETEDKS